MAPGAKPGDLKRAHLAALRGIHGSRGVRRRAVVDVRGEQLQDRSRLQPVKGLEKQDGEGVGLLPAGAAGGPDPHGPATVAELGRQKLGQDDRLEVVEAQGLPEKSAHRGDQVVAQSPCFLRPVLQQLRVFLEGSAAALYGNKKGPIQVRRYPKD